MLSYIQQINDRLEEIKTDAVSAKDCVEAEAKADEVLEKAVNTQIQAQRLITQLSKIKMKGDIVSLKTFQDEIKVIENSQQEASYLKNEAIKLKTSQQLRRAYQCTNESFLKDLPNLNYQSHFFCSYSIESSKGTTFPLLRTPKKGCEIKLPKAGRSNTRGVCEKELCEKIIDLRLQKNFYDGVCLYIKNSNKPFEPDLAYIDTSKGIFMDIEVDEPYSGFDHTPIHYRLADGRTIDDMRNDYFTERGWTVLRFSEKQIYRQTKSCLKEIFKLLQKMDPSITMPFMLKSAEDLVPENMWTEQEVKNFIREKEREKMLGISKFIEPFNTPFLTVDGDYPEGQELERCIEKEQRKAKQQEKTDIFIRSPYDIKQYQIDLEKKETQQQERQHVSTQSTTQPSPSPRSYA